MHAINSPVLPRQLKHARIPPNTAPAANSLSHAQIQPHREPSAGAWVPSSSIQGMNCQKAAVCCSWVLFWGLLAGPPKSGRGGHLTGVHRHGWSAAHCFLNTKEQITFFGLAPQSRVFPSYLAGICLPCEYLLQQIDPELIIKMAKWIIKCANTFPLVLTFSNYCHRAKTRFQIAGKMDIFFSKVPTPEEGESLCYKLCCFLPSGSHGLMIYNLHGWHKNPVSTQSYIGWCSLGLQAQLQRPFPHFR